MAETYASPAKRRKMSDAFMNADLAEVGHSGKKSVSRLNDRSLKSVANAKQQAGMPAPHTPSGKKVQQASTADGLLSLSPQQLAPDLMLLNQLLGALYVTLPLVRSRGKPTTYQNLRVPVQNFCGREFEVKHVQQIKGLCPEALGWEHILAYNPTTKRQEQQLCLSMPTNPADPKQAADTTHMQQLLFQRLQEHQACAGAKAAELELPLAALPPPAAPATRDCTPSRQRTSSLLPSTPQTAPPMPGTTAHHMMMSPPPKRLATAAKAPTNGGLMSPPPARTRGSRRLADSSCSTAGDGAFSFSPAGPQPDLLLSPSGGAGGAFGSRSLRTPVRPQEDTAAGLSSSTAPSALTPALRPNRLFDTPAAATPQQASAARPNTHATPEAGGRQPAAVAAAGVKVRKLTFEAPTTTTTKGTASVKVQKGIMATSSSKASTGNAPKARGGIKFELGASTMALLKQVTSAEVKQEVATKQQHMEHDRALDMLPASFEVLRAIYGDRGPCVKPKAEVIQLLRQKSTSKSGMSGTDAAEQLELMLRLVPDFIRTVTSSGTSLAGISHAVRINRQVSWPAARMKLLAGAQEARTCGRAAAAQDLEQQHEEDAAVAPAAAAAVELEDDLGSSGSEGEEGEDALVLADAGQAAAEAAGAVDELGLDILSELGGSAAAGNSSKCKQQGLDPADEALMLLGGGCNEARSGTRGAVSGVLAALAVKAPARRAAAT